MIREKGNINQNVGRILFRSTVQDHYSLYTFKIPALFIGPIDRGVIHQQWHYYLCMYSPWHHIWSVFCNIFILVFSSKFSRYFFLVWSYRSKSAASLARLERIKPLLSCCSVGIEKKIGLTFLQSRTIALFASKAKINVFFKYFRVKGDTE